MSKYSQCAIVFTGGGTAGHVTPNMALIDSFKKDGLTMAYIGSTEGIEKKLIEEMQIPYYAIQTGKLRRYLTWQHLFEPFKMMMGIFQSFFILNRLSPQVVFSKGGFVSFPVVFSAWMKGIPVVAHESDMTPGLANKISMPFVKKFCVNFPDAAKFFRDPKHVFVTGTPVREVILTGTKQQGLALTGFNAEKPVLMVMGGSMGARKINACVRSCLPNLLKTYQVVHLCGKGNIDESLQNQNGYAQYQFLGGDKLAHVFALSDMVISRSGANSLYELLTLAKPHILIPLSKEASRGDQIDNAAYFEKQGVSVVIQEQQLSDKTLLAAIERIMCQSDELQYKIKSLGFHSATLQVKQVIQSYLGSENVKTIVTND